MRRLGLRGKVIRAAISNAKAACPPDRVNRQFRGERLNQLWVSDFTYVSAWQGWQYVAFVIDVYARRIVGCRVGQQFDAHGSLTHHCDRRSQYVGIHYSERLEEAAIEPSVGSRRQLRQLLGRDHQQLAQGRIDLSSRTLEKTGNSWNCPSSNGCHCLTTTDCLNPLGTFRRQRLKRTIAGNSAVRPSLWRPDLNKHKLLHATRCDPESVELIVHCLPCLCLSASSLLRIGEKHSNIFF